MLFLLEKLFNHFKRRVVNDNRGFLGKLFSTVVGGVLGGKFGKDKSESKEARPEFTKLPEYEEAKGARGKWWEALQRFGGEPGYGAIQPDWGQIWENAQRKARQYFWGSPTDPGVVGKVKASAARRGVSESPALENMITRMGATEANVIQDLASQEAQKKAELSESGRLNYLANLQNLSLQKPGGQWWTPWARTKSSGWGVTPSINFEV